MSSEPPASPRALEALPVGPGRSRAERLWEALAGRDASTPPGWSRPAPGAAALRIDLLVGIGTALLIAVVNWVTFQSGIFEGAQTDVDQPLWLGVVVPIVLGAAVAFRRRYPQLMLLAASVGYTVALTLGYLEIVVSPNVGLFLFYSAGAWSTRRTSVTVLRLAIAAMQIAWSLVGAFSREATPAQTIGAWENATFGALTLIINIILYVAVFWLGNAQYARAGHWATMVRQFDELQANRAQLADQAVRLDRIRIARELHDSVAHHVSLMGLQAAVAGRVLGTLPESESRTSAETAMGLVESNAREAIEELQGILVALRSEEGGDATDAPSTRTLDQIPALLDAVRSAGMSVDFHEYGSRPAGVTPLVEMTVYRVLQEALTNVRKHAGAGAAVDVRIRFDEASIELDVTDDGFGARAPRAQVGGRGITGMRERALAVGGTVVAAPRETRGYRVLLAVPLRATLVDVAAEQPQPKERT